MEDKDKNLENFFQKKFDQNPSAEPWNTPEDDVWAHIKTAIAPPKKEKKRFWFFFPFLVALAGFTLAGYFLGKIQVLENQLNTVQSELGACKDVQGTSNQSSNMASPTLQTNEPTKENTRQKNDIFINENTTNNRENLKKKGSKKVSDNTPFSSFFETSQPIENSPKTLNPNTESSTSGQIENIENLAISPSPAIPSLPLKAIDSRLSQTIIIPIDTLYANEIEKVKTKKPFYLGLHGQYLVWNNRIKGDLNLPLSELLSQERTDNSFSFGLMSRKAISNRLSLDLGVSYAQRRQTSVYELEVPYTLATEHSNAVGGYDNEFSHSLPTSLGFVQTELVLSRDQNSTVIDEEPINIDFAFKNKERLLNIPVQLSYFPVSMTQGLFFSAGVNTEFVLQNALEVTQAKSNHSAVHEKSVSLVFPDKQISTTNFSALLGLGYQVRLSNRVHAMFQLNYQHGISNLYKRADYRHKIDAFSMNAGVYRRF